MRHRTKFVAGSARCGRAARRGALRRRSRGVSLRRIDGRRVRRRRSSESALSGIARGGTEAHDRQARGDARSGARATPTRSRRSVSPTRCAGARPATPATCRARDAALGAALAAQPRRPDRNARSREPGADPTRVRRALVLGRRTHASSRRTRRGRYGVIGDAQIELGRYHAAFATFERMVSLKPNLASYARIAYARELSGDTAGRDRGDGARARRRRRSAGVDRLGRGRARQARVRPRPRRRSRRALPRGARDLPRLRLRARAARPGRGGTRPSRPGGRARSAGRRRDPAAAVRRPSRRPPRAPGRPRRGEAPAGDGRRDRPAARRRTASASTSSRPSTAPTTAIRPAETVALARRARAARPSIYGDDALGWALARAGRCTRPWPGRSARCGSARAMRCSGSTVATPRGAPETGPG